MGENTAERYRKATPVDRMEVSGSLLICSLFMAVEAVGRLTPTTTLSKLHVECRLGDLELSVFTNKIFTSIWTIVRWVSRCWRWLLHLLRFTKRTGNSVSQDIGLIPLLAALFIVP